MSDDEKCCALTRRRGKVRYCNQRAIIDYADKGYCYYHNPNDPHCFGGSQKSISDFLTKQRLLKLELEEYLAQGHLTK